jgi:TetR/AcrR family transcriptional repressor of lmrAB and yxaGH operons
MMTSRRRCVKHHGPATFLRAYCETLAGWMEESEFRSGCPIATTLLETAPDSPSITAAGRAAIDGWIDVIAGVFAADGLDAAAARDKAQVVVAAIEGSLVLARVRRSARPILDCASLAAADAP